MEESGTIWDRFLTFESGRVKRRGRRRSAPECGGMLRFPDPDPQGTADLVMTGRKTAFIWSMAKWLRLGLDIPRPGVYYLLPDGSGRACAVLRAGRAYMLPYREMTEELAVAEGLDSSLQAWQQRERALLMRETAETGAVFTLDAQLVALTFTLSYFERNGDDTES